jgi:hypothetical protein
MTDGIKDLVVVGVISLAIFWLFKPLGEREDRKAIQRPLLDNPDELEDDTTRGAYEALCAYVDAYNDGEPQSVLDKIKNDFKTKLDLVIYTDSKGKLAVKDTLGNEVLSS